MSEMYPPDQAGGPVKPIERGHRHRWALSVSGQKWNGQVHCLTCRLSRYPNVPEYASIKAIENSVTAATMTAPRSSLGPSRYPLR